MTESKETYVVKTPSKETCLRILQNRLQVWQNEYYSHQQDAIVMQAIENSPGLKRATEAMKSSLAAIQVMEGMITEKEQEDGES